MKIVKLDGVANPVSYIIHHWAKGIGIEFPIAVSDFSLGRHGIDSISIIENQPRVAFDICRADAHGFRWGKQI